MTAVAAAKAVLWVVAAGSTFESSAAGGYGKDHNNQKQHHDFVHGKLLRMDGNPQKCRVTVHITGEQGGYFATLLAKYILPGYHGPAETAPMTSLCPRAVSDGWRFVPVVAAQAASIKAANTTRNNWAERFMIFLLFVG
ncbi:MAG: hypothetical protein ACYC9M_14210 [Desulfobulbaceae bacterium]